MFTWILSLHTFYTYFTHGPNTSASAQYDNTRGAWLTQEGCTVTERKEGRRGSVVVSTPAYHAADRGSNPARTRRDDCASLCFSDETLN